ncbi:MAG: bifunctional protein HldE [Herpetosiphonaceae bacterium]|nr:MAG: bifunctional protein HldE [Herpetosiphonaceae bacterium]
MMNENLLGILDRLAHQRILVIGDAMLDSYLEGFPGRLCREAPVPVVTICKRQAVPGGAANTAVNVHALGGSVVFLSAVGDDHDGETLLLALIERGISTEHILLDRSRHTLVKNRVIAADQLLVRFDQGSTGPVAGPLEEALIDRLYRLFPAVDAVIISDYGYGILTPRLIEALAMLQSRHPRIVIVDSKNLPAFNHMGITAVKPNYQEALQLLGGVELADQRARVEWITAQGDRILEITGAHIAAVTLDSEGALIFERGSPPYRTYARPATNARAAGAGDTFISALALALAAGASSQAAAELASAAAAIVVGKEGTATCSLDELREYLSPGGRYITDLARLEARLAFYRQQGYSVVFTNGCFDILHRGHISFLSRAKSLGDVLIVGVNADDSVRRLKGEGRPINSLEDRVQILAALSCVDHLIAFDEQTPHNLIRTIRPQVFVKGGDYTRDMLPEAALVEQLGGRVEILPYEANLSTTSIIERIRQGGDHLKEMAVGAD